MDPAERVQLVAGKGIEDDANYGRSKRQITIIEKEVLDRIREMLPAVEPAMRRANVMVSGIRLEATREHVLTLGGVRIHIHGETRPCERMDAQVQGFREPLAVLVPHSALQDEQHHFEVDMCMGVRHRARRRTEAGTGSATSWGCRRRTSVLRSCR